MKIKDINKTLPKSNQIIAEDVEVNASTELEHIFFSKTPREFSQSNYRTAVIDFSIANKIPLSSTPNNIYELSKRFIEIRCPQCGDFMKADGGFGDGHTETVSYLCPVCKTLGRITLSHEGVCFIFNEDKNE